VVYVGDGRSREVIRAFEFGGNFAMPGCNVSTGANRSRPYSFEVRRSSPAALLDEFAKRAPVETRAQLQHTSCWTALVRSKCDIACYCAAQTSTCCGNVFSY
jgi:hypothetical protein